MVSGFRQQPSTPTQPSNEAVKEQLTSKVDNTASTLKLNAGQLECWRDLGFGFWSRRERQNSLSLNPDQGGVTKRGKRKGKAHTLTSLTRTGKKSSPIKLGRSSKDSVETPTCQPKRRAEEGCARQGSHSVESTASQPP